HTILFHPSPVTTPSATTELYTLSLHDALPIFHELTQTLSFEYGHIDPNFTPYTNYARCPEPFTDPAAGYVLCAGLEPGAVVTDKDRKSTRLNSSHVKISYAVFCLKKKKQNQII